MSCQYLEPGTAGCTITAMAVGNEIVAAGERRMAAEAARLRAEADAQALAELAATAPAILNLLTAMSSRLAGVEAELASTKQMVMGARIRRPHRDANGQIDYVIDEIVPPDAIRTGSS